MIKLRNIAVAALAAFALTSCSASESAGGVKSYLTGHGFAESNITQMTGEDYKKTQSSSFKGEGLKEYLAATKPAASDKELPEVFYCWFFENMDQADAFVKEYVGDMYHSLDGRAKDPTMGSRNNTAYCGTSSIAVGLGWSNAA
ncbi:MAG: hypothetical protein II467_02220 [Bacilli bacterium]|nr:hypothetical protein [Bacilli bacterium]MBQ4254413.1 hypothetical protein [Bacilli bacterium]